VGSNMKYRISWAKLQGCEGETPRRNEDARMENKIQGQER
jgi:hypothetical protein